MIETQATVVAVVGEFVDVATVPPSACGSCGAKAGCGTSLLATWFPTRRQRFRLRNHVDARAGDAVVIGLNESSLQRFSLLLYGLPLVGLLIGAISGEALMMGDARAELGGIVGGLSGLIAALLALAAITRKGAARRIDDVRLLRIEPQVSTVVPTATLALNTVDELRKTQ